ncbi:hypothetical protein B296_00021565 [Ensete ventricosum]|uniref:Uncharacterized protein n=1 Tax=Ensete ventricosum TaxID=4639 RepID=A0A426XS95_ENSVE|nr:hypothetical protein B296_00021565 [Ensete ventricosum]
MVGLKSVVVDQLWAMKVSKGSRRPEGHWLLSQAKEAKQTLVKDRRKLPRRRRRHRATVAWVLGLSLALLRMRRRHKTIEAWVLGLSPALSRIRQRRRAIDEAEQKLTEAGVWLVEALKALSRMRQRRRAAEAWVLGLPLVFGSCTVAAQESRQQAMVVLPRPVVVPSEATNPRVRIANGGERPRALDPLVRVVSDNGTTRPDGVRPHMRVVGEEEIAALV